MVKKFVARARCAEWGNCQWESVYLLWIFLTTDGSLVVRDTRTVNRGQKFEPPELPKF